jgi:ribosome maturation factor RimP
MAVLKQTILELVERHLPDESHFIVEVAIEEKLGSIKLLILIDADQGITIDSCARISRAISEELESQDLMDQAYILEVSSPGLDYPLKTKRQYQKNIDRELKLDLNSGLSCTGKLIGVEESGLKILVKKKEKGKKAVEVEQIIPFSEVKKSIVQVSFK